MASERTTDDEIALASLKLKDNKKPKNHPNIAEKQIITKTVQKFTVGANVSV